MSAAGGAGRVEPSAREGRRGLSAVAVGVLALAALVVLTLVTAGDPATTIPLDPANPGPDGSQALYRVLAEEGVDTEIARGADALEQTTVDEDTVVVVSQTGALGASTIARLRRHAARGSTVLLAPPAPTWRLLGGEGASPSGTGPSLSSRCARSGAPADLVGLVEDLVLEVDTATTYPESGCFGAADGRATLLLAEDLVVIGAAEALTNAQVLRGDNAAFGLRLLGRTDHLVWYVPDLADLSGADAVAAEEVLPPWLGPALALALVAGAGLLLWRGRRLGALATEPLPVVVRAAETTRSRARLYRRAGDRDHTARILRTAARERTRAALALGAAPDPTAGADADGSLLRTAAAATGRSADEIAWLLSPAAAAPGTDHDLITLAQDLDQLDREVRQR